MTTDARRYGQDVERLGLSTTHKQVLAWIAPGSTVLELGCASGYIGRILIEEKGCQVTGVEFDANAASEARARGLTVIEGSLEDRAFRDSITGRYDYVVASDVIEHLRNPAEVLEHFKQWLAPGGQAIISVPNIAAWEIRHQLFFKGDFEYKETGILDRTHVHFFTWVTLHKLLAEQNWSIVETMVAKWELPVARGVLVSAPKDVRVFLEKLNEKPGFAGRALHTAFHGLAAGLERGGTSIVNSLAKNWPNLCAQHIAMLLRPPAAS